MIFAVGCDKRIKSNGWCARAGDVRVTKASTKLAGSPRRHTAIQIRPACHTLQARPPGLRIYGRAKTSFVNDPRF